MKNSTDFKVEHGVPIPQLGGPRNRKYPWDKLQVGDSFTVPLRMRNSVSACAARYRKVYGKRFSTRMVGDDLCRVWRVE